MGVLPPRMVEESHFVPQHRIRLVDQAKSGRDHVLALRLLEQFSAACTGCSAPNGAVHQSASVVHSESPWSVSHRGRTPCRGSRCVSSQAGCPHGDVRGSPIPRRHPSHARHPPRSPLESVESTGAIPCRSTRCASSGSDRTTCVPGPVAVPLGEPDASGTCRRSSPRAGAMMFRRRCALFP